MKNTTPVALNATISEVMKKYPQTADVMLSYGLQCVGCAVNKFETIEQGALGHGMDEEMVSQLLEDINLSITKKPKYKLNPQGITLSPRAIDTLKLIAQSEDKVGQSLKVKATPTSIDATEEKKVEQELDYFLDLVKEKEEGNLELEWKGFKIFIDQTSLDLMKPSVIDYLKTSFEEGFKILSLK